MGRQERHTAEQIIAKLREADFELRRGDPVGQICCKLESASTPATAGETSTAA